MIITECNPIQKPVTGAGRTRRPSPPREARIAVVHPADEHLVSLLRLLTGAGFRSDWVTDRKEAQPMLAGTRFPVLICERDLPDGCWRDVMADTELLPARPLVIVTSPFADEHLWGEVLNSGGYDVLRKPFQADEVLRVVNRAMAWRPGELRTFTTFLHLPRSTGAANGIG